MKIKTDKLTGAALDWAVAVSEGATDEYLQDLTRPTNCYTPSTDWAQGGPIIEWQKIALDYYPDGGHEDGGAWGAATCEGTIHALGPTALIAAMRCYVQAHFGDDVEIPEELL